MMKGRFILLVLDQEAMEDDIYRARKNIDGDWHQIENLGPLINSSFDEDFIFVHPDGKALYFSSKGHNSMGGYDIFKTEILSNGSFSKPENLGFPVNSPGDDVEFRLSTKGDREYILQHDQKV